MKRVVHVDNAGRRSTVAIPDDQPDNMAPFGALVGPPPLGELGLPPEIEVRLANQLQMRGVLTWDDFKKKRNEVSSALVAALRSDIQALEAIYYRWHVDSASD